MSKSKGGEQENKAGCTHAVVAVWRTADEIRHPERRGRERDHRALFRVAVCLQGHLERGLREQKGQHCIYLPHQAAAWHPLPSAHFTGIFWGPDPLGEPRCLRCHKAMFYFRRDATEKEASYGSCPPSRPVCVVRRDKSPSASCLAAI